MLAALSVAAFLCLNPSHHDGDSIYCAGQVRSNRLYGIDAPEMPGACRPGRECTPGNPYAARDHLKSLTEGRQVTCEPLDTDVYGRTIVRCSADGVDLSCAMVKDGYAVERYGTLSCDGAPTPIPPPLAALREPVGLLIGHWQLVGWVLLINAATYLCFRVDKQRAQRWERRIPENLLLSLAVLGGSPAGLVATYRLRHKTRKQPFATHPARYLRHPGRRRHRLRAALE
jgi:uncharacterized membrane protein YsdA (DUF1294 family)